MLNRNAHVLLMFLILVLAHGIQAQVLEEQPEHAPDTYSVVYDFGFNLNDPINPSSAGILAQGRDGNLYSSAVGGSKVFGGTVYKVTPSGTLTRLYDFGSDDGGAFSGLTLGLDGNFYGATAGNAGSYGIAFRVSPGGNLKTLHTFTGGSDGGTPLAPPVQGTDGNFYGTAVTGGNSSLCRGCGTVYKVTPSGAFTTLYQFDQAHGRSPIASLTEGTDGNFYGITQYGGSNDVGVVFKITPTGKLTVLYNFDGTHGSNPTGPLVQDADGDFYGTAAGGGDNGYGVVFRMTPSGNLTVLHSMGYTADGATPEAGLVEATDGSFYGVNADGGPATNNCPNGCGTIFKITTGHTTQPFLVVHSFDLTHGQEPFTTLYQHTNGLLYGTTYLGGTGNVDSSCINQTCGVLYRLNINAAPFIRLLSSAGKVGSVIEILGQGFTGTTSVSFNGTGASFVVRSDGYLTATVPSNANTGPVTVSTPRGKLSSNQIFRVTPQILSFSPVSGQVGTSVTIKGVSLTRTSRVTFGGVVASNFTVDSDSEVTAIVPIGAKTGKIVITTKGGSVTSSGTFTVTS